MQVASKIIEIEHRLHAIAKSAGKRVDLNTIDEREVEIDNAKAIVIKECCAGLEKTKEAIVEYISSQWDKTYLEKVDKLLNNIRGALTMIPLPRSASIIRSCAQFIQDKLLNSETHPDFQVLDSLADTIASVEYYLERLTEDLYDDVDSLLDLAEESITTLGYSLDIPTLVSGVAHEPESTVNDDAPLLEEEITANSSDHTHEEKEISPVDEPTQETLSTPPTEEDESDIDDEIIEIFIEEAGEVLETLHEFFPQWRNQESDNDSLVVVRRAFHTLKGSGRMVEAYDIGELAWAIENMLNRVIDQTISVQPHVFHIIEAVIDLVPELVKAFEARQANPKPQLTEQYSSWAHQIAEGNYPEELAQPLSPLTSEETSDETESLPVAPSGVEDAAENLNEEPEVDDVLQEIFCSESTVHLETIESFIKTMEEEAPLYTVPTDAFQRALHTLKGSAKMAQVLPIAKIAEPLELFTKELIAYQVNINEDILQLLKDAVAYIYEGLDLIRQGNKVEIPKIQQLIARTIELHELSIDNLLQLKEEENQGNLKVDPRMLSLVMAEEMALLLDADLLLKRWQDTGHHEKELEDLLQELTVLAEGARQANLHDMASLCTQLKQLHEKAIAGVINPTGELFTLLHKGHDELLNMVDTVAAGQNAVPPPASLTEELASMLESIHEAPSPDGELATSTAEEFEEASTLESTEEVDNFSETIDSDKFEPQIEALETEEPIVPQDSVPEGSITQHEPEIDITDKSDESTIPTESDFSIDISTTNTNQGSDTFPEEEPAESASIKDEDMFGQALRFGESSENIQEEQTVSSEPQEQEDTPIETANTPPPMADEPVADKPVLLDTIDDVTMMTLIKTFSKFLLRKRKS